MVADQTTGVPARMAWDHGPLADASRERCPHSAFDHPPTSLSTPRRRTPVYGSKIFASPAELEGWMMTISSFNISPSAWGNMFGHGLNSSRTTASATRRTSRGSLSEISRGRMSALETFGTSRVASRSPTSPYGITSVGSQSGATPFLMSLMRTSLVRSSLGQPASPSTSSTV